MALILLALVLVLAITMFQVVQGMFSALIMTLLTVLCAAVAFNYYEPLASMLYDRMPEYADGAALIALFIVPLWVLRMIIDRIAPSNVVMGIWADRIGGGVAGFITAQIVVGVLMISIQMLPWGETVLGYSSHDDTLQRDQTLMPFYPDEFTLGMIDMLSVKALASDSESPKSYYSAHDDLLLEAFCARNTAGKGGRISAEADQFKLLGVYEPSDDDAPSSCDIPDNPLLKKSLSQKIVIVRVQIDELARDETDNWYRMPGTHFRLVSKTGRSHYPMGYLTAYAGEYRLTRRAKRTIRSIVTHPHSAQWTYHASPMVDGVSQPGKLIVERPWNQKRAETKKLIIDWVYRIDSDEKADRVVFRRVATVATDVAPRKPKTDWPSRPTGDGAMNRMTKVDSRR